MTTVVEGQAAADLSVEVQTFGEDLIINMETARQIGIYPSFDIMGEATLTNLDNIQSGVNKRIADKLGVVNPKILAPKRQLLSKLVTFVPQKHTQKVLDALFAAGAGKENDDVENDDTVIVLYQRGTLSKCPSDDSSDSSQNAQTTRIRHNSVF